MKVTGFSRTKVRNDHALITSESHVVSTLASWKNTEAVILISPQMGARFTQYIAYMERGSLSSMPAIGVQRFLYVMEGEIRLFIEENENRLVDGDYAYIPSDTEHSIRGNRKSKLCIFEKPYLALEEGMHPSPVIGHSSAVHGEPFMGDTDTNLKTLLPEVPGFDMAINLFTFQPGASLPIVETHVMEHGMIFLRGQGVYRLGESWYQVGEDDVIWMAPYLPQWFACYGKVPATYLYYKDINRDPLLME